MSTQSDLKIGRVRPPKEWEKRVIEPLKDGGFFSTKYEVMAFAGSLGFAIGVERKALDGPGEGIRLDYFQSTRHDLAIDVIGVVCGGDEDNDKRLRRIGHDRTNDRIQAFEEYAALGLAEMYDSCYGPDNRGVLEGLLSLIDKYGKRDAEDGSPDAFDIEDLNIF